MLTFFYWKQNPFNSNNAFSLTRLSAFTRPDDLLIIGGMEEVRMAPTVPLGFVEAFDLDSGTSRFLPPLRYPRVGAGCASDPSDTCRRVAVCGGFGYKSIGDDEDMGILKTCEMYTAGDSE